MEPQDRKLYVQILAQMLIADGVLADEERAHLDTVMDGLDMPEQERAEALRGVSIDSEMTNSEKYFLERVETLLS